MVVKERVEMTLYVSDLDGTLLDQRAVLSSETVKGINELIDSGLKFTIATARDPSTVVDILKPLNLKLPIILSTGAYFYDLYNNKVSIRTAFGEVEKKYIFKILQEQRARAFVYSMIDKDLCIFYQSPITETEKNFVHRRNDSSYIKFLEYKQYKELENTDMVLTFLLYFDVAEEAEQCAKRISEQEVNCYCYPYEYGKAYVVEVFPKQCTKGTAVKDLADKIGCKDIVSFGDGKNDVSMFQESRYSCAVANASSYIKQQASHVIESNVHNGVVDWLKKNYKRSQESE